VLLLARESKLSEAIAAVADSFGLSPATLQEDVLRELEPRAVRPPPDLRASVLDFLRSQESLPNDTLVVALEFSLNPLNLPGTDGVSIDEVVRRDETLEFTGTMYWMERQTRSRVVFVVSRVEPIRLLELRIVHD